MRLPLWFRVVYKLIFVDSILSQMFTNALKMCLVSFEMRSEWRYENALALYSAQIKKVKKKKKKRQNFIFRKFQYRAKWKLSWNYYICVCFCVFIKVCKVQRLRDRNVRKFLQQSLSSVVFLPVLFENRN